MKLSSIVLRVVLSAALVLNGISTAVASAQMVTAAKVAPAVTATVDHGHHGVTTTHHGHGACHEDAAATAADDHAPPADTGHGKHGSNCCQAGMCACHCAQQAQVSFVPPVLASPQVAQTAGVRAMSSAHESPRLPHLIRPPICQAS
jgi:hypothetical protein